MSPARYGEIVVSYGFRQPKIVSWCAQLYFWLWFECFQLWQNKMAKQIQRSHQNTQLSGNLCTYASRNKPTGFEDRNIRDISLARNCRSSACVPDLDSVADIYLASTVIESNKDVYGGLLTKRPRLPWAAFLFLNFHNFPLFLIAFAWWGICRVGHGLDILLSDVIMLPLSLVIRSQNQVCILTTIMEVDESGKPVPGFSSNGTH